MCGRFDESPLPPLSWSRAYRFHRHRRVFFLWYERESRRDRIIALQPNQKIKDPHSPSNGKTVANISAQHRVHCWCKPEDVAMHQKHFDELLRVPCVDKAKVNVHRTVDCSLVTREQAFRLSRMVK